jgi:MFS family permease
VPSNRALPFALTVCYAGMMALAVAINLLPVFLVPLGADFGNLSDEQLGRIGAITFVGLVSAIAVTGPLVDRLPRRGPKVFAILGNLSIALGLMLLAMAPTYLAVLAACLFLGFGAGTLDMVLSPIISALQPRHRTVALNMLHSFYCTGAVLTILAAAMALRYGLGWRACAWLLVPAPLLVGLAFAVLHVPALVAEGSTRTPLHTLARLPYFRLALLTIFCAGATELAMAYWLPTYAMRDLGFTKWTADMSFLGFSLAMAVGRLAVGFLGHKVSGMALLLGCSTSSAVLFVVASFVPVPLVALAACILAGLTGSCLWPSTLAITADRYPHGGASMFGILAALGNAGGIVLPWLAGLVADHSNLHWGLATGAVAPLVMIPLLLAMRQIAHRAGPEAPIAA